MTYGQGQGTEKGLKPYWNHYLNELCRQKKDLWVKWIKECRINNNDVHKCYKNVKAVFRSVQKAAIIEYEVKNMVDITKVKK